MKRSGVFLSYSHLDRALAADVVKGLSTMGIHVWWDRLIPDGRKFREEINRAIEDADVFLLIWSDSAAGSNWIEEEIDAAENSRRTILILKKKGAPGLPLGIRNSQVVVLHDTTAATRETMDALRLALATTMPYVEKLADVTKRSGERIRDRNPKETTEDFEQFSREHGSTCLAPSSFCPERKVFYRSRLRTTAAWIPLDIYNSLPETITSEGQSSAPPETVIRNKKVYVKTPSEVYVIHDPIRPFESQIGLTRSLRPGGRAGAIVGKIDTEWLHGWYMQIGEERFKWLRTAIAEIATDPQTLDYIAEHDSDQSVRHIAANNPFANIELQEKYCFFCDCAFQRRERLSTHQGAYIMTNAFPFGPYFHYVVAVDDPVHSWDTMELRHFEAMNFVAHKFLNTDKPKNLNSAYGIEIGLNSSARHLVLGKRTQSSAGASIAHVHKQLWGTAPGSHRLSDQLVARCSYWHDKGVDYLKEYLTTLSDMGWVLWHDKHAALYVPFCQTSAHELQVMLLEPHNTFLDLNGDELASFSRAEYLAVRLFDAWGITSFNEMIMNSKLDKTSGEGGDRQRDSSDFRVIATFVTRETDLGISELNLQYVVDRHGIDTIRLFLDTMLSGPETDGRESALPLDSSTRNLLDDHDQRILRSQREFCKRLKEAEGCSDKWLLKDILKHGEICPNTPESPK